MNGLSLIDSILDGVYGAANCGERNSERNFVPAVDIEKNSKAYVLYMDLPGKTEADIEISVKENLLTIASAKADGANGGATNAANDSAKADSANEGATDATNDSSKKEEEVQYLLCERSLAGNFKRTFTLANDCDATNISAQLKNGVLTVTIPVKAEAEPQKIRIQAA
ncbi:MAG: Hsp20/alpha crystallin family protein [Treponema sp.]|nr:Hsp20/alpha crystallin family protein [Treponema sp.]